ncbi:MAG: adenylyl-sulfate kinase, partial [Planctomycetota bacterium]
HLETVHIASDRNLIDLRFPVQHVLRPDLDFRGYCGTIASGVVRPGDRVVALPSGAGSRVKSIVTYDGELDEAFAGMAVTITLEDEIDISRGDTLVAPNNAPALENDLEAMVVWMHEDALEPGRSYLLKQGTVVTPAVVSDLRYRINVGDLHRQDAGGLALNEIGRVRVECSRPLAADPYSKNRATGSFILIDRLTNATMAAGMIVERRSADESLGRRHAAADAGTNIRRESKRQVTRDDRIARTGEPFTLWITGLPRSGKSTIAYAVEKPLFDAGHQVHVLDGEVLRLGVNSDLGFSGSDRWENQRRAAELAKLFNGQGVSTIIALVSPLDAERERAREIVGQDRFVGIFCDAPVEICEARDEDGLYKRARAGEITNVTGVDAPYERPTAADLVLDTVQESIEDNVAKVLACLRDRGLLSP